MIGIATKRLTITGAHELDGAGKPATAGRLADQLVETAGFLGHAVAIP